MSAVMQPWASIKTIPNTIYHREICRNSTAPFYQQSLAETSSGINTLRPRRNEQHFADDIFKRIFFNENVWISIKISQRFVPKGPINNIPVLVQIMAWRRSGDKPLSEPMMVRLLTHICVARPQWVKVWMNNEVHAKVYSCRTQRLKPHVKIQSIIDFIH